MKHMLILLLLGSVVLSCSSTESATEPGNSEIPGQEGRENPDANEPAELNIENSGLNISGYQSSLSDTYSTKNNEIPQAFTRLKSKDADSEDEKDLYEGFRVQIYSGQNVAQADTAAARFRTWSEINISGYQAETYVFFKSPYYRVHVGDFHDRSRAIEYSNLIKRKFRDAWVVYDRVNPWNVPPDTVSISVK